jgi:hypothetical protein
MVSCNPFCPLLTPDHVQEHAILCDRKNAHHLTQTSSPFDADKLANHEGRLHHSLHVELGRGHGSGTNKSGLLSGDLMHGSEVMKRPASLPTWTVEFPDPEFQFMEVCG